MSNLSALNKFSFIHLPTDKNNLSLSSSGKTTLFWFNFICLPCFLTKHTVALSGRKLRKTDA